MLLQTGHRDDLQSLSLMWISLYRCRNPVVTGRKMIKFAGDRKSSRADAYLKKDLFFGVLLSFLCISHACTYAEGFHERLDMYRKNHSPQEPFVKVARLMYETTSFPHSWIAEFKLMDEIWVPSKWQQEVFENCQCTGGVPIRVLPEIIDTDVTFNPSQYTLEDAYAFLPVASKAFTFVSVGKWELRKDFELLVDVFLNEFREELDKVHLVLRTSPPRFWQEQVQQKHNLQQPLPITILEQLSTRELALLYKAADAFVIASHGEGFGRPPAEAISMAVPTIAIDWSGLSAFISNDTAYPLHVSTLVNVPGGDSEQWAHITAPQLASVMRHVYTYPEEAKARGMAGRQYMVDNFSPTAVRRQLVSLIQRSVARNTK
eukprot:m.145063 g.145063  ORF g.145063 m.145063 type:complete len:375 (-) comp16057_c0_seq7:68-1192(-)